MFIQNKIIHITITIAALIAAPTLAMSTYAAHYPGNLGMGMGKGSTYGAISSIQTGEGAKSPTWILAGHWATNIVNKTKTDFNQTNPSKFDAFFSMVMLNGSARHQHHLANFSLTDVQVANDTTSYKGLATVTMKTGPVKDVQTEIKIINNNVISIWFDPAKVKNHFGESPIYGLVFTEKDIQNYSPNAPHKENSTELANTGPVPSM
jgi:hypothetical protein